MKLSRRNLLKGLGGVAVALPMLEAFGEADLFAQSGTRPKRFVLMYAGVSTGTDASGGTLTMTPTATGRDYPLTRALTPLGDSATPWGAVGQGVQGDVSLVTGLTIPWADSVGATPPPGGRSREFHYNTVGPQISGVRGNAERTGAARGPSADQIAADVISADRTHRSLSYRVQAARYVGDNSINGGQISYRLDDAGRLRGVDPIGSPRLAHRSLFSAFTPPDEPDPALAALGQRSRRSALGLLRERTRALVPRVGAHDRVRLERHLAEVEALEARIASLPPETTAARCVVPAEPTDPELGGPHSTNSEGNLVYVASAGYSGEQLRAELMCDMTHMAFACDLTRVAAIRLTHDQSFLNMREPAGVMADAHESTHGAGGRDGVSDVLAWHVWHYARLVRMLRDTPEPDGSSMLDNTAVVLLFEGGFGFDPESSTNNKAHSTENMVALLAGRVGGLDPGAHISAPGLHPANVLASALGALGLEERLGEVNGRIPELFG